MAAKDIAARKGFSYRALLGELVYPYVICRLDIGFAVCFLARFSTAPHEEHYDALKAVVRYLRKWKSWGIIYRRSKALRDLPTVPFPFLPPDVDLPEFPKMELAKLYALLDAAHATDSKKRRSVTGLVVLYAMAAIVYKSRLQPVTATSSTEAEF